MGAPPGAIDSASRASKRRRFRSGISTFGGPAIGGSVARGSLPFQSPMPLASADRAAAFQASARYPLADCLSKLNMEPLAAISSG
jgi:hypothetical protein